MGVLWGAMGRRGGRDVVGAWWGAAGAVVGAVVGGVVGVRRGCGGGTVGA